MSDVWSKESATQRTWKGGKSPLLKLRQSFTKVWHISHQNKIRLLFWSEKALRLLCFRESWESRRTLKSLAETGKAGTDCCLKFLKDVLCFINLWIKKTNSFFLSKCNFFCRSCSISFTKTLFSSSACHKTTGFSLQMAKSGVICWSVGSHLGIRFPLLLNCPKSRPDEVYQQLYTWLLDWGGQTCCYITQHWLNTSLVSWLWDFNKEGLCASHARILRFPWSRHSSRKSTFALTESCEAPEETRCNKRCFVNQL